MRGYRISLLDSVNLFVIAFVSFVLATSLKTLTPPLAQALGTNSLGPPKWIVLGA